VVLPDWPGATVGGVLAVGRSGVLRLGQGPVRDCLLQARFVDGRGTVVKAGGPTVKNVTGYDLCRLLVGSLGLLGFIGDVILRTRPRPAVRRWFAAEDVDPFAVHRALYRPAAILWDGTTTWLCLEGHPDDVAAELAATGAAERLAEVAGPPTLPSVGRASLHPRELSDLTGQFVAEVGVGVVHLDVPVPLPPLDPATDAPHRRLRAGFDPLGRLNPGRSLYREARK
jgi:glycolate oxidase FAD binding subunit